MELGTGEPVEPIPGSRLHLELDNERIELRELILIIHFKK
jgi:hypothetical protein